MRREYITRSPKATKILAQRIAKEVQTKRKGPVVFALIGELGSGKTTFLQGLALGLGVKKRILSPTFVLMKRFKLSHPRFKNFYHIDCWRLESPQDILSVGWDKILSPENIISIEWADKIRKLLPKKTIEVKFKIVDPKTRKITIKR